MFMIFNAEGNKNLHELAMTIAMAVICNYGLAIMVVMAMMLHIGKNRSNHDIVVMIVMVVMVLTGIQLSNFIRSHCINPT